MCTSNAQGRVDVAAPARILRISRYRSLRGAKRAIVTVEVRKFVREKRLKDLLRVLGQEKAPLRSLRGVKPLRSNELIYRLGQLWPSVTPGAAYSVG
jgi:hypothetical protein